MRLPSPASVQLLHAAYAAFNARDIEAAVVLMTPDVAWPMAFKGGFVRGPAEIRDYWSAQWREIDPTVTPTAVDLQDDGTLLVDVHQVVRDLSGSVLVDEHVGHRYTLRDGLIAAMEVTALPATVDAR